MAVSCKYDDEEPAGSGATEVVSYSTCLQHPSLVMSHDRNTVQYIFHL
jgi:hypothetical protein